MSDYPTTSDDLNASFDRLSQKALHIKKERDIFHEALSAIADNECNCCAGDCGCGGKLERIAAEALKKALALLLVLLLPSLASAQSQVNLKPAQTAIILGNVADIVSTELALQRGGVHEGNAIMSQRMTQRIALKAAGTAAQVWIVGRIGKEHPTLAKVVGYSAGAFFGGVTLWNASR